MFDLFNNPVGFEGTEADVVLAAGENFHDQQTSLTVHLYEERKVQVQPVSFKVNGLIVHGHIYTVKL